MLKEFYVLQFFVVFKIVRCYPRLPEVFITDRGVKPSFSHNTPKLPLLRLSGQTFSLPQCCQNASEWEDVDLSIQILTDYSEPDPERSTFASFINLIKFILIKEELSCLDAMKGPIIQVKRPEGPIFKTVTSVTTVYNSQMENKTVTVGNSQILNKIETALANKPKHKAVPIEFYDNIDITNMIPIWRPRGNSRRKNQTNTVPSEIKINSTCAKPKATTNLGKSVTVFSGNLKPACLPKVTLTLLKSAPNCKLQSLPSTNIKPVLPCCGGNCNLCPNLASQVLSDCPKLASASISGCPNTNMVLGNPFPNMLGCPCSANILTGCQAKQPLTVLQETVPLMNGFGNIMTTTVLMPYTVSQLVV